MLSLLREGTKCSLSPLRPFIALLHNGCPCLSDGHAKSAACWGRQNAENSRFARRLSTPLSTCREIVPEKGDGRRERGGMGRAGTGSRHLALLRKRELDRSQLRISRLFSEWPPLLTRSNNIAKKSHVTAGIGWQNIFILEHFGAFFEPKVLHYR